MRWYPINNLIKDIKNLIFYASLASRYMIDFFFAKDSRNEVKEEGGSFECTLENCLTDGCCSFSAHCVFLSRTWK